MLFRQFETFAIPNQLLLGHFGIVVEEDLDVFAFLR